MLHENDAYNDEDFARFDAWDREDDFADYNDAEADDYAHEGDEGPFDDTEDDYGYDMDYDDRNFYDEGY